MNEQELYDLDICPCCRGAGYLTHEGGCNVQVEGVDCGAHTFYVEYETEEDKKQAEKEVVRLWNLGKVIRMDPGE